jgi:hypothetical protein
VVPVEVAALDPAVMGSAGNPALTEVASTVREKPERALESL